jgi:hypothetical protein
VSLLFLLAEAADFKFAECALVDVVVRPAAAHVANPYDDGAFCLDQIVGVVTRHGEEMHIGTILSCGMRARARAGFKLMVDLAQSSLYGLRSH